MTDLTRLTTALEQRYRIERQLGAGGMATVYLATDLKHDREVALKASDRPGDGAPRVAGWPTRCSRRGATCGDGGQDAVARFALHPAGP
jgi:serine/threonine protein kinase